jgi:DNA-binding transcriptional LysR family regulator
MKQRSWSLSHPAVQVTFRIAAWSALQWLVERGETDLGVLACDPDVPRSPFLEYEYLFDESLCVLLPQDQPLARSRRLLPHALVEYPLILPPKGGADRRAVDRFLRKHNLHQQIRTALVCGLIDVASKYVALGIGLALMYVSEGLTPGTPGLLVRPLDPEIERLPIEMAVRKGIHQPAYVDDFRRIVRQHLAKRNHSPKRLHS